jgi:hypothetical protein
LSRKREESLMVERRGDVPMVMDVGVEDCNGLIKGGDEAFQSQGGRTRG